MTTIPNHVTPLQYKLCGQKTASLGWAITAMGLSVTYLLDKNKDYCMVFSLSLLHTHTHKTCMYAERLWKPPTSHPWTEKTSLIHPGSSRGIPLLAPRSATKVVRMHSMVAREDLSQWPRVCLKMSRSLPGSGGGWNKALCLSNISMSLLSSKMPLHAWINRPYEI